MAFDPQEIAERYDFQHVEEMVFLFPRGYNIAAQFATIPELYHLPEKTKVALRGRMVAFERQETRGRVHYVRARLEDDEGRRVICRWACSREKLWGKFKNLQEEFEGREVQIHGSLDVWEPEDGRKVLFVTNPKMAATEPSEARERIVPVPIYELKKRTKPFEVQKCVEMALEAFRSPEPPFPEEAERAMGLPPLLEALQFVHGKRPVRREDVPGFVGGQTPWHKRVRMELLWYTLLKLEEERAADHAGLEIPTIRPSRETLKVLLNLIPFELTDEQKRVVREILVGYREGRHKKHLIQGDVGSGKTIVSFFPMLAASTSGYQSVMIAPSAILARQHYQEFKGYADKLGVPIYYYTGDLPKREKEKVKKAALSKPDAIFIGTHSLNSLAYVRLGVLVVDEEQKIGRVSKEALLKKSRLLPHQILMSATPIPRTLASTMFADFEALRIHSKPPGRKPVVTELIRTRDRARKVFEFAERQFLEGKRQTLVVVPSIGSEEMASVEVAAAICRKHLPESSFIAIHGEMKSDEIEKALDRFVAKEAGTLVATTMAEAGISIPSIDLVVALDPDRYGLASLHQLRGRAGRSSNQAYCALIPLDFDNPLSDSARERLEYFCSTHDGFELAEYDMRARGTGNLIGNQQSGGDMNLLAYLDEIAILKRYVPKSETV